jgi:hypothetical protein
MAFQTVTQSHDLLVIPDDHEVCCQKQEELIKLLSQQYVSTCLLGNRINADLVIRQINEEVSLSMC